MNKISYLANSNKLNVINQNCVIINPIQTFEKKIITKYDEEEMSNLATNINLVVKYQQNIKMVTTIPYKQ